MSGMRPVAVAVEDRAISSADYIKSHKVGCRLQGFQHLFDTALETDNTVRSDVWPQHSTSTVVTRSEVRKKTKQDEGAAIDGSADELEDSSENSTDESGPDEDQEENVETELQESQPPPLEIHSPTTPTTSVDPQLVTSTEYQRPGLKRAQKGGVPSSFRGKFLQVVDASPAKQMYKKSAFALSTVDPADVLEKDGDPERPSDTVDFPAPPALPVPVVNCPSATEDVDMGTELPEAISSPPPITSTPEPVIPPLQAVPKVEPVDVGNLCM